MATSILMPALSPTMTEGNLVKWHKDKGDRVKAGDILAEIETDKATMEVEAVDEGVLGAILVQGGTADVKVNTLIAVLLEEGEGEEAVERVLSTSSSQSPSASEEHKAQAAQPPSSSPAQSPAPVDSLPSSDRGSERVLASPLARRLAQQHHISLHDLQGSGPRGRVVKQDVLAAVNRPSAPVASKGASQSPPSFSGFEPSSQEIPVSMMRKVIARRLSEAKQEVPHFYVSTSVELDALLRSRRELNETAEVKISVNDMVILATAKALKRFPEVNVAWAGDTIRLFERVDISVAVSLKDGLITPVIRGAESKGLIEISSEMKALAARAREGKLRPEEFQGGTFSLSNLGMFGVEQFTAIVNPPQAGILAVGAGTPKAVVRDGTVTIATVMNLTLSVDHRAIDGAQAAQFLQALKQLLEQPARMLL